MERDRAYVHRRVFKMKEEDLIMKCLDHDIDDVEETVLAHYGTFNTGSSCTFKQY